MASAPESDRHGRTLAEPAPKAAVRQDDGLAAAVLGPEARYSPGPMGPDQKLLPRSASLNSIGMRTGASRTRGKRSRGRRGGSGVVRSGCSDGLSSSATGAGFGITGSDDSAEVIISAALQGAGGVTVRSHASSSATDSISTGPGGLSSSATRTGSGITGSDDSAEVIISAALQGG